MKVVAWFTRRMNLQLPDWWLFVWLLAFVACAAVELAAQQSTKQSATTSHSNSSVDDVSEDEVISVRTTEVLLPVTVRNGSGQLVTTLKREDFRVFEDGREQRLSDAALRQVPVDVVLMVDASSSVSSNLDDFRSAAEGFISQLGREDRFSLIKFDDRIELLQDWTSSRMQFRRAMLRIKPGMFTRFHDALLLAAKEQFAAFSRRHAVVVLSDGIDSNRGTTSLEAALSALLRAQATVYVVSNTEIERQKKRRELDTLLAGSNSAVRFNELRIDDLRLGLEVIDASERRLEQLTTATGGRLYKPASFAALDDVYREVAEELRHQYALYYSPTNKATDNRFRRVQVKTADPDLRVTTRVGYYAAQR